MAVEAPKDEVQKKVFLFSSIEFFCKRDRDMKPLQEISQRIVDEVCEHPVHNIVCLTPKDHWAREQLKAVLELFDLDCEPIAATSALKKRLMELGIRFKPVNPRQMTYLNLYTFAVNNMLTCILKDDYAKVEIEPDKEVTFQDLVQKRKRDGWP
jgi:hypothetical protein